MKQFLISLLSCLVVLSCVSKNELEDVNEQIEELKSQQIATIESQIESILKSIGGLEAIDSELKELIKTLEEELDGKNEEVAKALGQLKDKDESLEQKIGELKTYCNQQDNNIKDWVSVTYTTLEQHAAVLSEINSIKVSIFDLGQRISALDTDLNNKITDAEARLSSSIEEMESSLKSWVNEQLTGYYSISEIDAKISALQSDIKSGDDKLAEQLAELSAALEKQKNELTDGYKQAISDAIKTNNGVIDGKISAAIGSLNEQISSELDTLSKRIDAIEARLANLEEAVAKLMSRIQSMIYVPRYSDGASTMWWSEEEAGIKARDTLDFRISPSTCLDELIAVWDVALKSEAVEVRTRAGVGESVSMPVLSAWGENGILSVEIKGDKLDPRFFSSELPMYCTVLVSDGNNEFSSDYIRMLPKSVAPHLSINTDNIQLTSEAGASTTIDLVASHKWSVTSAPTWLTISPNEGYASVEPQTITISADANSGIDRRAKVTFSIGLSNAVLTVTQKGDAGSEAEALVYKNDFDKADAENNSGWPQLDKSDCWKNETGNGIADIKYEFKGMSARQSSKLSNDTDPKYSKYEGSGHNKLFFGSSALFAVKEIDLGGKTSFELSFGGWRYSMDDQDNTFKWEEFKVYVSVDGVKGVELPCTFAAGEAPNGAWDLASGKFTVPAGTEKLAIVFKVVDTNAASKYSIDDLKLIVSGGGAALDFSQGVSLGLDNSYQIPDTEDVTNLADIIKTPVGSQVTITNATVTAVNTRGYIISDGTHHIYVYIGKDANPGLKIGDKASITGTFKYYKGEYEIVDASQKKVGTAAAAYPTPVILNASNLTGFRQATPTDEDSPGYTGPWFPIYVKCNATVKKEGSYTNFVIEGYDKMLSLAFADKEMYKDASGTEYFDGNEVEITGYLLPWEAKTAYTTIEYHPILAISLTGEATYNPAKPSLDGDDVFVASNVVHDYNIGNGEQLKTPVTVGDATFTFAGGANDGKYYNNGSGFRLYAGGSLTVSSALKIIKIEYLFAPKDNSGTYMPEATNVVDGGTLTLDAANSKAVWTGSANSVKITRPTGAGQWRIQEVAVTYDPTSAAEPRLAVAPAAIPVKAGVTSAKFTVQSNIAWKVESNNESFVPSATEGENNAEITVTFPANESLENDVTAVLTVSPKDSEYGLSSATVTITQAKAIDQNQVTDLSKILANTAYTKVEIYNAIVSAVNSKSFIVTDGTSSVYIDVNGTHTAKVGDKVNVSGTFMWYYGLGVISRGSDLKYEVKSSGNEVPYPAVTEMAGADFAGYESNPNKFPIYAKFTGTLAIVNGKYQFSVEGLSSYILFVNPDSNVANDFVDGETAVVLGYYTGYHTGNKFHQFVYVSKDEGSDYWSLLGNFGGGTDWTYVESSNHYTNNGEDTWEFKFTYSSGLKFKFLKNHDWNQGDYGLTSAGAVTVPFELDVVLTPQGHNIELSGVADGTQLTVYLHLHRTPVDFWTSVN